MTQTRVRPQFGPETALAPLGRQDLPSFVVALPSAEVAEATDACAALGIQAGSPAPDAAAAAAAKVAHLTPADFGLVRLRLPGRLVPHLFRYVPLEAPTGRAVLFADPAAFETAPEPPAAEPAPPLPAPLPPAPSPAPAAPVVPADLRALLAQPLRVTFETDAEGRLLSLSPAFVRVLGARAARFLGAGFAALETDGLVRSGDLLAPAAAGGSFSDVKAFVPALGPGEAPIELTLGGAPLFDAARRRRGLRGFGVIRAAAEPPVAAPPPAPEPAPDPAEAAAFGENVVPLRSGTLSPQERSAFREIARTLAAAIDDWPRGRDSDPRPAGAEAPADQGPPGTASAAAGADDPDLLDHLPLGVVVQQEGEITYLNRAVLAWTGWPDLDTVRAAGGLDRLLVRDGGILSLLSVEGGRLPVDVRLVAAPFLGRPALIHVIRPLAEADAREARAVTRREALDMVPWPVFLLESEGAIRLVNEAAAERIGFPAMDLSGEPFTIAVAPEDRAAAVMAIDRIAASGTPEELTLIFRDRAGACTPGRAAIVRAGSDAQLLCVVVGPVAAARPAAPAAASPPPPPDPLPRLAGRLRDALAAPIASLTRWSETEAAPSGAPGDALAVMLATFDDLSALADAGRDPGTMPAATRCDLAALVADAAETLALAARRRRVALRIDAPDSYGVEAPRAALVRLVRLMLEEALSATPAGGSVCVSVVPRDDAGICLKVSDGGESPDAAALAAARDPLAEPAATPDRFGTAGRPLRFARLDAEARALGGVFEAEGDHERGMIARLLVPGRNLPST